MITPLGNPSWWRMRRRQYKRKKKKKRKATRSTTTEVSTTKERKEAKLSTRREQWKNTFDDSSGFNKAKGQVLQKAYSKMDHLLRQQPVTTHNITISLLNTTMETINISFQSSDRLMDVKRIISKLTNVSVEHMSLVELHSNRLLWGNQTMKQYKATEIAMIVNKTPIKVPVLVHLSGDLLAPLFFSFDKNATIADIKTSIGLPLDGCIMIHNHALWRDKYRLPNVCNSSTAKELLQFHLHSYNRGGGKRPITKDGDDDDGDDASDCDCDCDSDSVYDDDEKAEDDLGYIFADFRIGGNGERDGHDDRKIKLSHANKVCIPFHYLLIILLIYSLYPLHLHIDIPS